MGAAPVITEVAFAPVNVSFLAGFGLEQDHNQEGRNNRNRCGKVDTGDDLLDIYHAMCRSRFPPARASALRTSRNAPHSYELTYCFSTPC